MKTKNMLWALWSMLVMLGCSTENAVEELEQTNSEIPGANENVPGGMVSGETIGDLLEAFTVEIDSADDENYTEVEEVIPSDETDEEYDDFVENSTFSTPVTITYSGTSATVTGAPEGVTVSQNGAHVTITSTVKKVEYILTGSSSDGSVKIYSDNKFQLTLNGVSLTHPTGAPINIQSSKRAFVVCAEGTDNVLEDGDSYATPENEDEKACLFSEGKLIFSGAGQLTVTGHYKHGICSDDYVYFRSGSRVTVAGATKDGVHANDKIVVGGGTLHITADGDGMECEAGYIALRAGEVTVQSVDDAITASYEDEDTSITPYIGMYGGLVKLSTTGEKGMGLKASGDIVVSGGVLQAQVAGAASKGLSCDGNMQIEGGKVVVLTTGDTLYEDDDLSSAAGIKCDGALTISNATVAVKSSGAAGKGINCDGDIHILSGLVKVITTGTQYVYGSLDSSPKGIKSDANLTIDGGLVMVRTSGGEGSEGIESKNIMTINGGEVAVSAYDDCLNATNQIAINGGEVYCYSSGNDAIDSNGTLTLTGGTVVAVGTSTPEGGIDCDQNTFSVTGGTLVAVGGSNSSPTSGSCSQPSIVYGGTVSSGAYFCIQDSEGKAIVAYQIPCAYNQMSLLATSPNLKQGSSYTLLSGGTVSGGTDYYGLLTGGTYSGGSQLASVTLSSMVTTAGSSSGMGGGPGQGRSVTSVKDE